MKKIYPLSAYIHNLANTKTCKMQAFFYSPSPEYRVIYHVDDLSCEALCEAGMAGEPRRLASAEPTA